NVLVQVAVERGQASRAAAGKVLAWTSLIGAAALLLTAMIVLVVRKRLVGPMVEATRVIGEIAQGNLHTEVPAATRRDEIGDMLNAVTLLKANSVEKQRLEHERARLTDTLAERETLLSALLESSPSGLILGTREGETRLVTAKWTEMLGYTQEDLTGTLTRELYVDPNDRERFVTALERDGKVRDYESRFRRKDGSEFWGMLNSSFVEIGSERLLATWVHDITSQREAAERIKVLADEQRTILDNLQVAVIFSGDGKILRANRKTAEIFGFASVDELIGKPTSAIWRSQEVLAAFTRDHGAALAKGSSVDAEVELRRVDGQSITCRLIGQPMAGSRFSYSTVWIIDDITERKASDARIAGARAQLQAMMDGTPALMFMKDLEGRYQRVNRAFAEFIGLEIWQIIGRTDPDLYPAETAAVIRAEDRHVIDSGETVRVEQSVA